MEKLISVIDHYDDSDITVGSLGSEKLKVYHVNLYHPDIWKRCTCPQNIFKKKQGMCKHEAVARDYLLSLRDDYGKNRKHPFPMKVHEQHGDEFIVKCLTAEGICFYVVSPNHPDPHERCECSVARITEWKCRHQKEIERYCKLLDTKKIRAVPTYPSRSCVYC